MCGSPTPVCFWSKRTATPAAQRVAKVLLAIDNERQLWVAHVLERPAAPDLAGYLAATLTVEG